MGAVSGAKCGMYLASLGEVSIGCDSCNSRYEPTHVCLGLPDSIVNTMKEYGGTVISFCCTSCRLEGASGNKRPQSGSVFDGRGLNGAVEGRGLNGGINVHCARAGCEAAVQDCEDFVCCNGYFDKQYETHDGDCWSVKCQPR